MNSHSRSLVVPIVVAATGVLIPADETIAQSAVAVSPFVSYVPSAATNPLAGMSLTFGGTTGLALRAGADISLSTPRAADSAAAGGARPWAGDADVMVFLGGLFGGGPTMFSRALNPYLFSGIGVFGGDSAGTNVVHNGWSYGAGATLPLGPDADLFGEARWRMPSYVLPTSNDAPASKSELRFGLAFHVGGSGDLRRAPPQRRRRYADEEYDDGYDDEEVVAQAAPAPIIVQAPAPVIVQQPAPVIVQQQPRVVHDVRVIRTRPDRVFVANVGVHVGRRVVRRSHPRPARSRTVIDTRVKIQHRRRP